MRRFLQVYMTTYLPSLALQNDFKMETLIGKRFRNTLKKWHDGADTILTYIFIP